VISWKGFGRGDRDLIEVLYRHLSGETEENFTNINEILKETDEIRRTGISGVQILLEMYNFYLQTDTWFHPPGFLRNVYCRLYFWR
jgi:aminoglycoside N3'-acetyltransferase